MKPARQAMSPVASAALAEAGGSGFAFRIAIDNIAMLRGAYGADVVERFCAALVERINNLLAGAGAIAKIDGDPDRLWVGLPPDAAIREQLPAIVDDLLLALGARPVLVDGTALLAAVSIELAGAEARRPIAASGIGIGSDRVAADMRVAVAIFDAIAEGRLYFLFQSIVGAHEPRLTLYQEGFTRIVDRFADDELQTPRGFIPALERLGLTRRFDRAVVEGGIEYLRANPGARIGCNISALSAIHDSWWSPVLDRLRAAPDIASRLVIELTETTPRGEIGPILEMVRALRRAGCRIAIDNFGAGFSGLRFAVAAAPDIIKIDACYVREQAAEAFGPTYLGHLVGLAACLAGDVVVVGIESEADLSRARHALAGWVQGRHVAPAALSRAAVASAGALRAADESEQATAGATLIATAIRERTLRWAERPRTADERPWTPAAGGGATPSE